MPSDILAKLVSKSLWNLPLPAAGDSYWVQGCKLKEREEKTLAGPFPLQI